MSRMMLSLAVLLIANVVGLGAEEMVLRLSLDRSNGDWGTSTGIVSAIDLELHIPLEFLTSQLRLSTKSRTDQTVARMYFVRGGTRLQTPAVIDKIVSQIAAKSSQLNASDASQSQLAQTSLGLSFDSASVVLDMGNLSGTNLKVDSESLPEVLAFHVSDETDPKNRHYYWVQISKLRFSWLDQFKTWWGVQDSSFGEKGIRTLWNVVAYGSELSSEHVDGGKLAQLKNGTVANGVDPALFQNAFSRLKQEQLRYNGDSLTIGLPTADIYYAKNTPWFGMSGDAAKDKELAGKAARYFFTYDSASSKSSYQTNIASITSDADFLTSSLAKSWVSQNSVVASTIRLSLRRVADSSSYQLDAGDFFFVPESPDLLDPALIDQSVAPLTDVVWSGQRSSTIQAKSLAFTWVKPQSVGSVAVWTSETLTASNVTVQFGSGSPVTPSSVKSFVGKADGSGGYEEKTGSGRHFYVIQLPTVQSSKSMTVTFGKTSTIYKISAHSSRSVAPAAFNVSETASGDYQLTAQGSRSLASAVVVTAADPTEYYSFMDVGYGFGASGGSTLGTGMLASRPISYSFGGWETPVSYSEKVLANPKVGLFPWTELDLSKGLKLDSNGVFVSAPASDLGAKPAYFASGLRLPYPDSTFLNPKSPFFTEKLAGVDSLGLVSSLLWQQGAYPSQDATASGRWNFRTTGPSSTTEATLGSLASASWFNAEVLANLVNPSVQWYRDNSTILWDIKNIHPGQLLVGWEGSKLLSAIVLDVPSTIDTVSNADEFRENVMKKVKVAVISPALGALTLSTWNSFTLTPESFHVRSLNRTPGNPAVAWTFKPISVATSAGDQPLWIPNTEEVVPIGRLAKTQLDSTWPSYTGVVSTGTATTSSKNKDGTYSQWTVRHATDVNYSLNSDVTKENVYRNGLTTFYLVASASPLNEATGRRAAPAGTNLVTGMIQNGYVVIAKITRPPEPTSDDLTIDWLYNDAQYYGETKNLLLVDGGQLYVHSVATDRNVRDLGYLGIVAENPRAGDDLSLDFGFEGASVFTTGRMAVVDKKALWRANLYIDEGDGNADWNNRHKWIDGNEWNQWSVSNGTGGQVLAIPAVTSPIEGVPDVTAVTYDYPERPVDYEPDASTRAMDTPFAYSTKAEALMKALNSFYDSSGIRRKPDGKSGWAYTTAPGRTRAKDQGTWMRYWDATVGSDPTSRVALPGVGLLWGSLHQARELKSKSDPSQGYNYLTKDGKPIYEVSAKFQDSVDAATLSSAKVDPDGMGTDCVAFAKNSYLYASSPYVWTTSGGAGRNYPETAGAVVEFASSTAKDPGTGDYLNLKLVVPGDVMWYGKDHIAIVLSNKGTGKPEDIQLIEAEHTQATKPAVSQVTNVRNLASLDGRSWVVGRLK